MCGPSSGRQRWSSGSAQGAPSTEIRGARLTEDLQTNQVHIISKLVVVESDQFASEHKKLYPPAFVSSLVGRKQVRSRREIGDRRTYDRRRSKVLAAGKI